MDILEIKDKVCKENKLKDEANPANVLLTTLKVDSADIKKVQMKIRTAEGQQGSLNVFVIEKSSEQPMCAMLEIPLKPLNLHERIAALNPNEMEELPLSKIVISGRFTQSDGLQWISNCIPNVPNVVGDG